MTHEEPTADAGAVRVMLVDDSAVVRGLQRRWISATSDLVVVGTAANGLDAIAVAAKTLPDLIVLDLEMPIMDGLAALPQLLACAPNCKILVASALSTRNAKISLQALNLGASDYVAKPGSASISREDFERELLTKLRALSPKQGRAMPQAEATNVAAKPIVSKEKITGLALVASTGGPVVLNQILPELKPMAKQISLFIVQHMPAHFTPFLGRELAALGGFGGGEAAHGQTVEPGQLYLAPGDYHMRLARRATGVETMLDQDPPEHFCRPAADPFLKSFARIYGPHGAVIVLTGMGRDGADGAKVVREAGGTVLAQDQKSSIVWGMPGAAVANGSAHHVVSLAQMPQVLHQLLNRAPVSWGNDCA